MISFLILGLITTFLISYILIPIIRKMAIKINLVDKPNARKVHTNSVPLVGGIAIFISSSIALSLMLPFNMDFFSNMNIYFAVTTLLIVGVIDDKFDLRASLKLAIQLVLAHFIIIQGIKIESLQGLFGVYVMSDWMQYLLTLIVITGVVNAFNLMDGIDGLAAGLAILGFVIYTIIALLTNQYTLALIFISYIGGLLAFLKYNLSKNQKVFMGDAGSLIMGFILVVAGISMIQTAQNSSLISIVTLEVVSVLIIPVFDALRVFRKRIKSGKSPFSADKTHLHHLILSAGAKHKSATLSIIAIMALILIIGFVSYQLIGLTLSISLMLLLFYLITSMLQFHNHLNFWKNRIHKIENINI